jgi:prepilin peptidase CpaA
MSVPAIACPALIALAVALAAVAYSDWCYRTIPNLLVGGIALAGLAHAAMIGGGRGLLAALAGGVAGIALLYFQFSRGLMGAGDVKLLGAVGVWTGALGALYVLLAGSLLGGVLAVGALAFAGPRVRAEVSGNVLHAVVHHELPVPSPSEMPRRRGVPFGVALAVSAAAVLFLRMA